ncbi:hypothetical protein [Paenibacillus sp. GCM10027626]|uniref:hypothetical protein n=1 Tax=Paenibacillus sp. GCM10027626 TaxID=3273411 RepID=UPI0036269B5F
MDAATEMYLLKQQLAQHRIWLGEAQLYILQLERELERLNMQHTETAAAGEERQQDE